MEERTSFIYHTLRSTKRIEQRTNGWKCIWFCVTSDAIPFKFRRWRRALYVTRCENLAFKVVRCRFGDLEAPIIYGMRQRTYHYVTDGMNGERTYYFFFSKTFIWMKADSGVDTENNKIIESLSVVWSERKKIIFIDQMVRPPYTHRPPAILNNFQFRRRNLCWALRFFVNERICCTAPFRCAEKIVHKLMDAWWVWREALLNEFARNLSVSMRKPGGGPFNIVPSIWLRWSNWNSSIIAVFIETSCVIFLRKFDRVCKIAKSQRGENCYAFRVGEIWIVNDAAMIELNSDFSNVHFTCQDADHSAHLRRFRCRRQRGIFVFN